MLEIIDKVNKASAWLVEETIEDIRKRTIEVFRTKDKSYKEMLEDGLKMKRSVLRREMRPINLLHIVEKLKRFASDVPDEVLNCGLCPLLRSRFDPKNFMVVIKLLEKRATTPGETFWWPRTMEGATERRAALHNVIAELEWHCDL